MGVTILEALLATFMMGIFLVIISDLTSALRKMTEVSEQRESSLAIRQSIFSQLRADLTAAVEVSSPADTVEREKCILKRLKPEGLVPSSQAQARLPSKELTDVGYTWDPIRSTYLDTISYEFANGTLLRHFNSQSPQSLQSVSSFRINQPEPGLFRLRIEFKTTGRTEILKCVVDRG